MTGAGAGGGVEEGVGAVKGGACFVTGGDFSLWSTAAGDTGRGTGSGVTGAG